MNRIKMIQQGWEGYKGSLMGVEFEDGKSVNPVEPQTAARLGCIVLIENVEDGLNPSASQVMLDNAGTAMKLVDAGTRSDSLPPPPAFTRAGLEAVADEKGIVGLRAIAPEGIKGTSINGLIDAILATQAPVVTQPVESVAEVPAAEVSAEVAESAADADKPADDSTPAAE